MTPAIRRASCTAVAVALLVGAALFVRDHHGSLDDEAFVYLRYARNLREGCGLRWNCQDTPVEAFGSPAWLALVVLVGRFTTTLVRAAEVAAALGLGAALMAALFFADRLATRAAGEPPAKAAWTRVLLVLAVALALAADHDVLQDGVLATDSPLRTLCLTLFATAVVAGRPWLVVIALLAAATVRPENAVLAGALPFLPRFGPGANASANATATATARERRLLWLVLGSGLALEIGVRFSLFGDLVPNTFWAEIGGTPRHAMPRLPSITGALLAAFATFPALALAPLVLAAPRVRREAGALLGAFALWMGVSLWTSGGAVTGAGARFASPLVPVCTAFAVLGAVSLAERLLRPSLVRAAPAAALAVATLLAVRASFHRLPPAHGLADVRAREWIASRIRQLAPGAHIAAVPIGALGMYSHLNVLGLTGVTRRDLALRGEPVLDLLDRERPELVVTTVSRPEPFESLDGVRPSDALDRAIVEGVRSGELRYHLVDMEVTAGTHWLLFAIGPTAAAGAP